MSELYTHDEVATQEGFIAVVNRFPRPVPPEHLPAYRRLRTFGLRRGWPWPYRNFVPSDRRATPEAPPPPLPPPIIPGEQAPPPDTTTPGTLHAYFTERYEYSRFTTDDRDECWRAWRATPFNRMGERWPADYLGPWEQYQAEHAARLATPRPAGQSHGHVTFIVDREYFIGHLGWLYSAPRTAGYDDDGFRLEAEQVSGLEARDILDR